MYLLGWDLEYPSCRLISACSAWKSPKIALREALWGYDWTIQNERGERILRRRWKAPTVLVAGEGGVRRIETFWRVSHNHLHTKQLLALRNKRFQSSYCAKVRAGAKREKRCSLPNFLYELARKRLLRRLPPHKSWNSDKIRNVSVKMRDKCISLVCRDIPGDYLNLQMFFASLSDFFYEVSVNKHVCRIQP